MSTIKHSLAPWWVGYSTIGATGNPEPSCLTIWPATVPDGGEGRLVCKVSPEHLADEEDRANARLIAAAPDLLDCLQELIAAKEAAEADECYALNEGLHLSRINMAFDMARGYVKNATTAVDANQTTGYLCAVCHQVPVNANQGYDTCTTCLTQI